jgi:O-antigen/teichoic acid export membrane protein
MAAGALAAACFERARPTPDDRPVPEATYLPASASRSTFLFLLLASLLAQLLITSGPVAASQLAGPGEAGVAGQLLAGLLLARVPLLAVASVQTALLPRLTQLHAAADEAKVRGVLRDLAAVVLGLTAVGVAGAAGLGPVVLRLLFGPDFDLGRLDLALLVLGVGGYLVALLVGLGLVARRQTGALAASWAMGVAMAGVVLLVGPGLVRRVELSLVAGAWCSAAVVLAAVFLWRPERQVRRAR